MADPMESRWRHSPDARYGRHGTVVLGCIDPPFSAPFERLFIGLVSLQCNLNLPLGVISQTFFFFA